MNAIETVLKTLNIPQEAVIAPFGTPFVDEPTKSTHIRYLVDGEEYHLVLKTTKVPMLRKEQL